MMTPAPGKIHTLPVKVSYTVDSSAQTYFTVLPERQKVYVHPRPSSRSTGASAGASSDAGYYGGDSQGEEGGLGSCVLKSVAWGVCYASPECVPAPTSHDFSVYSLDPSPTSTSTSRAFPSQSDNGDLDPLPAERWDGKGFLSWALYEPNDGTTLIRGRVVYDPDAFEGVSFNPAGGLEGLLALSQEGEGEGEEGWGLEVQLSLRMVNLGGRAVGDKKEFGEMLARVKEGGAGRGGGGLPIMSLPAPLPAVRREEVPGRRRIEPRLIDQSEVSGGTFGISTGLERRGLGGAVGGPGPARTSSSAAANLPTSEGSRPRPPLPHRSSLSGVTSVPPSSVPMAATSSESSRPMFAAPPLPPASLTPPNSNSKPPASSAAPVSDRDERETTPPTAPTRRSPPPSTPSRLQAILRSDAKLSPNLARSLANNPTLLRLLKSVPASAAPLAALNKLRSPFDNESGEADAGGSSTDPGLYGPPPPPPAFLRSSPAQAQAGAAAGTGTGTKPSPAGSSASHAAATPNFNTPGSAATITKASTNGKKGAAASASASGSTSGTGAIGRMCDNCETTKSRCWHSRPSKAQPGAVMSVCEECAVYFNKHKKMRPVSLTAKAAGAGAVGQGEGEGSGSGEGTPGAGTSAKAKGKAKAKAAEPKKTGVGVGVGVGVGIGVGAGAETTPPTSVSKTGAAEMMAAASAGSGVGSKRKFEQPSQGVRSSPRRSVSRNYQQTGPPPTFLPPPPPDPLSHPPSDPSLLNNDNAVASSSAAPAHPESPARKRKKGVPPPPSPRRNTRAAAKEMQDTVEASEPTAGGMKQENPFLVSSAQNGQNGQVGHGLGGNGRAAQGQEEHVDIEAFLAQFAADGEGHGHGQHGHPEGANGAAGGQEMHAGHGAHEADGGDGEVDMDKWLRDVGIDFEGMEG